RFRTYTDGKLLLDTIFRFKGQCADAVVLTEIDRDVMDDSFKRRLFVGLTRARLQLQFVATESACNALGL
ncbi:MAG: nuclease, partial [Actinobacteria bacterium]|nr:nuclease [Actinomycetota bacterium]